MAPSIDREKVIETLQYMISEDCTETQFDYIDEIEAAVSMLKELEPVKPTYEDYFGNRVARCGKCNGYIVRYKYCPGCGKMVKWDD